MPTIETFSPTEVWTPRSDKFEFGEAIESARREMNQKNPDQLIHSLKGHVKQSENGIVFAVLKGDRPDEYSDTDALVMFNPFANTATANMLIRSEFIREVAKQADIRDESGNLKPVIMLASPGVHGSRIKLNRDEKKKIRSGDLGPAAEEYLKAVSYLNYGRVALLGASQGADIAISSGAPDIKTNLDRLALAAAEPAGVMDRSLLQLGKDFFKAGPDIDERAKGTGLSSLDAAHDIRSDYYGFFLSTAYPSNWRTLGRAMTANNFQSKMQSIIDAGEIDKIVIGYGDRSTITPAAHIEKSLAELHKNINKDLLLSIKVKGGTHAWQEELSVVAKLYLKALI